MQCKSLLSLFIISITELLANARHPVYGRRMGYLPLRELLTKRPIVDDGSLFRSAADLAESIAQSEKHRFKNAQTVATLLSNVFLRRRACSQELADAITNAAAERLQRSGDVKAGTAAAFLQILSESISATNAAVAKPGPGDPAAQGDGAAGINDVSVNRAIDLFRYAGEHSGLVCCEYRDYPRAHSEGKYSKLGLAGAKAIAAGGSFAMFIPFPDMDKSPKTCRHTGAIRDYIQDLRRFAKNTHHAIVAAALRNRRKEVETEEELAARVVRYERGVSSDFACHALLATGIQSRLFYVQIPLGEGANLQEVWEWVAADDEKEDFFIQRRDSSIPKQVARDQFFPVVKEWITYGKLLQSSEQVTEAIQRWNGEADASLPGNFWVVPERPTAVLQHVKQKFFP